MHKVIKQYLNIVFLCIFFSAYSFEYYLTNNLKSKEQLKVLKNKKAKFSIGNIVKHKHFEFRGVIYDVDFEFNKTQKKWDERSQYQVYRNLLKKDSTTVPYFYPTEFVINSKKFTHFLEYQILPQFFVTKMVITQSQIVIDTVLIIQMMNGMQIHLNLYL